MKNGDYYYSVRQHSPGTWGVAMCSAHTGDVKEWISLHDNKANAGRRATKLNWKAMEKLLGATS